MARAPASVEAAPASRPDEKTGRVLLLKNRKLCDRCNNGNDNSISKLFVGLRIRDWDIEFAVFRDEAHKSGAFLRCQPSRTSSGLIYKNLGAIFEIAR